jgi:hypothetical protein
LTEIDGCREADVNERIILKFDSNDHNANSWAGINIRILWAREFA